MEENRENQIICRAEASTQAEDGCHGEGEGENTRQELRKQLHHVWNVKSFAVDTSSLRTTFLPQLESSASDDRFVLTDTTVLETMKTAYWRTVAQNSFGALRPYLEKIFVAKAPAELIQSEVKNGNPTASLSDVIDAELTTGFRNLLMEIGSGVEGQNLAFLKSQIDSAQADLANHQLNGPLNQQGLRMATEDIKKAFKLREYRRNPDACQKELIRRFGIKELSKKATEIALTQEGMAVETAKKVSSSDCFCLRQSIGLYCLGWKWAMCGSLPQKQEKITNELMDLDQSLIGGYCDGILTGDNVTVSPLREDILRILRSQISLQ